MDVTRLSSEVVYRNPWLSVREDRIRYADGSPGVYAVVDKPDSAVVLPLADNGFHLVEQYRYPLGRRSLEFPSGSLPGGAGTPLEVAAAELAEATGLRAARWERLGRLHAANGFSGEGFHVFLATGLTGGEPRREVGEQGMRQRWFPRGEVERMLADGLVTDGPSAAAYLLLLLRERSSTPD